MEMLTRANGSIVRTNEEKARMIENAAVAYAAFMKALGFDFEGDPHSSDTPNRVAKAWVNDLAEGCFSAPPKITSFENTDSYDGIVFQGDIEMVSMCSHHHLAFTGKAHVAYIPNPNGKVIGLSKLNRVVNYFSRRPQVQENLTQQIHNYLLDLVPDSLGIAVMIEAKHTCASCRGVRHDSTMKTAKLSGLFFTNEIGTRHEFYRFIADLK